MLLFGENMLGLFKKKSENKVKPTKPVRRKYKAGLALSGGGTRGFAHVGVMKALDELGVTFDYVAGTSVGSIMGAMYASGFGWQQIRDEATKVTKRDLINRLTVIGSDSHNIKRVAERLLGEKTFDELKIPFKAVAVDIQSGDEVVIDQGLVSDAVAASSSVPILFTPYSLDGRDLVDGGLLNNMPADVCRGMGADVVVSVDLNSARGKGTTSRSIPSVVIASWNITTKGTMYKGYLASDVVITPDLSAYRNYKLDGLDEMIEEGYRATMEKAEEIKALLI